MKNKIAKKIFKETAKAICVFSFMGAVSYVLPSVLPRILNFETRKLREREIKFFKSYFGEQVDYDKIVLHNGRAGFRSKTHNPVAATTVGNHIYLADERDFKQANSYIVLHEVEHVNQNQHDNPNGSITKQAFQATGDYSQLYENIWEPGEFSKCNEEQQAKVLQQLYQTLSLFDQYADNLSSMSEKDRQLFGYIPEGATVKLYADVMFIKEYVHGALPLGCVDEAQKKMKALHFQFRSSEFIDDQIKSSIEAAVDLRTNQSASQQEKSAAIDSRLNIF